MLDRDQLEAFAAVLEFRSFERAAAHLNVTRGAVSQRIRALEEYLSRVLIVRGKPIMPTPHGEYLLRHVQTLRLLELDTLRAIRGANTEGGPLKIALGVDADSLSTWFQQVILDIAATLTVSFKVIADDQATITDMLKRGELLGGISTSEMPSKGFSSDALGVMHYRCVASPEFAMRAFPDGFDLQHTLRAHAVMLGNSDRVHDDFLAEVFGFNVDKYPRHHFPSTEARLGAIRSGIGYGLVPAPQVDAYIDEGELVDLTPARTLDVYLYWHQCIIDSTMFDTVRSAVDARARACLVRGVFRRADVTIKHSADTVAKTTNACLLHTDALSDRSTKCNEQTDRCDTAFA
jgi:LysR family transcriptional regulator (chromosome initiation inhibitor)